jgi:hypothetical protein
MKPIALLTMSLALALTAPMARAVEEPAFTIEKSYDGFEVRAYPSRRVAEVTVPGPAGEAGNQGFRPLFDYISGKNKGQRKIEMTAPVTQAAEPVRIDMTAPVTQAAADGGGFVVRFMMPAAFTLATLPAPLDARVRLREMPPARFAVLRYSGRWTDDNDRAHLDALRSGIAAAGLHAIGEPIVARYDPPFWPWFLRRNEVWIEVGPAA